VTILDRNRPVEQIITHPPVAVIEILSPEDTVSRMMTKLREYEQMGIKTILVLDPNGRSFRYLSSRLEPLPAEPFDLPAAPAASILTRSRNFWIERCLNGLLADCGESPKG